ncbi:MAG: MFS transporter [Chthoniobacterales bacterium]
MKTEAKPLAHGALQLLREGPFRRYIMGSAISDTGTWMQVMAQGWVMSTLTDKALHLGMVNLAAGLPMLALTMVGGSAADKYDKRKILLATQYVQIALAVLIGFLLLKGQIAIWHVFAVAVVLGISNSFEMPALSALVPELVRKDQIAGAIAMDRAVFHGSRLAGPAVGGVMISVWGAASAFFFNAISFVALIIALVSLPPRRKGSTEEEEKRKSGIKEGFRFIAQDKASLAMVSLIATTTVFVFPVISVMMPLYVRNVLGLGPDRLGFLMAASGIGSVVGAIGLLSVPRANRATILMCGVAAVAVCIFGLSRAPSFGLAALVCAINSIGLSMNFGLANTIVQERAPDYLRGRVSAVFGLSFFGLMPLAGLVLTSASDLLGMPKAMMFGALIYGALGLTLLSRIRRQCGARAETIPAEPPIPAPVIAR